MLERKFFVIVGLFGLNVASTLGTRLFLCPGRGFLLSARKEIDVRHRQIQRSLGRSILSRIGTGTELACNGYRIALMQVFLSNFAKFAPCGRRKEIGDLVTIAVLDAGVCGERERTAGSATALLTGSRFRGESCNGNENRHLITPSHTYRRVS